MANRTGKNSVGNPIALKTNTILTIVIPITNQEEKESEEKQESILNDIPIN
jgi:hypothetical protein